MPTDDACYLSETASLAAIERLILASWVKHRGEARALLCEADATADELQKQAIVDRARQAVSKASSSLNLMAGANGDSPMTVAGIAARVHMALDLLTTGRIYGEDHLMADGASANELLLSVLSVLEAADGQIPINHGVNGDAAASGSPDGKRGI